MGKIVLKTVIYTFVVWVSYKVKQYERESPSI